MRKEPHWVKLFLRELERTGNVRMSAERAGIDHSSAYQRRRRHAGFAERWEASVAASKRAGGAPSPGSPAASPSSPPRGEELVVHPDGKLIRAGPGRWNRAAERTFLAKLAETANVRQSAKAAGFSTVTIGARRLKDPQFDEACRAAIEVGKAALEAMLVEWGQRRFDPDSLPLSDKEPQVTVAEAISIIKLQRKEPGQGPAANGGWREPKVASPEEAERDLIRRLKIFARRVEAEDRARGWSPHEFPLPEGSGGEEVKQVWLPPGWRLTGPEEGPEG